MTRPPPRPPLFPSPPLFRSPARPVRRPGRTGRLGPARSRAAARRPQRPLPVRERQEVQEVPHAAPARAGVVRSEEHTSELQSQSNLVCRLLLEKKKRQLHLL